MLTTGVFVPHDAPTSAEEFVISLRDTATAQDLELEPGEWAEVRVAVGVAEVTGRERDSHKMIREAARKAESDLKRFPKEWAYPIVIFDD